MDERTITALVCGYLCAVMVLRAAAWCRWRRRIGGRSAVWGLTGSVAIGAGLLLFAVCILGDWEDGAVLLTALGSVCSGLVVDAVALVTVGQRVAKCGDPERGVVVPYITIPLWVVVAALAVPVVLGLTAVARVVAWVRIVRRVRGVAARLGAVSAMVHLVLLATPILAAILDQDAMWVAAFVLLLLCFPVGSVCLLLVAGRLGPEALRVRDPALATDATDATSGPVW